MPRPLWPSAQLAVDESDPFDAPSLPGRRIDLTDPVGLRAKLAALLVREGQLEEAGVTCSLKDRSDSCCSACPLRDTHRAEPIRSLCQVGLEQERTIMTMLASDA